MQKNDSKLKEAFREAYFAEFEDVLNSKEGAAHRFSRRFEKRGKEIIAFTKGNESKKPKIVAFSKCRDIVNTRKFKSCAAVLCIAFTSLLFVTPLTVNSSYETKIKWEKIPYGLYDITFDVDKDNAVGKDYYLYDITYFPRTYWLDASEDVWLIDRYDVSAGEEVLWYENKKGDGVSLRVIFEGKHSSNIDWEHTTFEHFMIDEKHVKFCTRSDDCGRLYTVFWEEDGLVFELGVDGEFDREEAIKVVKSVTKTQVHYTREEGVYF